MEEITVALTEAGAVGLPAGARDRWIAEARVVIEDRRLPGLDVMAGGVVSVMVALLLNGLVVEDRRRRRRRGLRVRAAG